jgi:hypothetical protein
VSELAVDLPNGLDQAFAAVAGELGMATASWLFVRAVARCTGERGVASLAERIGSAFPVLDAVAHEWLEGTREPKTDPAPLLEALGRAKRVVVVGFEASFLDALVPRLSAEVKIAIVTHSQFSVDWERVLHNYGGRVDKVDLDTFQTWAGRTSALLTFAYGRHGARVPVLPLWLRACGADVRSQFRALVGWDVLGAPLRVYPRWLVETDVDAFTHFVP